MDVEGLKLKIDSKEAQQDLAVLSKVSRKIAVEMNDNGPSQVNVSSNITVIAPHPDSFGKASGSIMRDQNRSRKRAAVRNLTGT